MITENVKRFFLIVKVTLFLSAISYFCGHINGGNGANAERQEFYAELHNMKQLRRSLQ